MDSSAALFYIAVKRVQHGLVLPTCFVVAVLCFYGALWLLGIDVATAQTYGLLLDPFEEANLYRSLDPWLLVQARVELVVTQLPSVLTDFLVVVLILAVAARRIGFFRAIATGIIAASILSIFAYSQVDVVRLNTTGDRKRSGVERGQRDLEILAERGDRVAILSSLDTFRLARRTV